MEQSQRFEQAMSCCKNKIKSDDQVYLNVESVFNCDSISFTNRNADKKLNKDKKKMKKILSYVAFRLQSDAQVTKDLKNNFVKPKQFKLIKMW